MQKLGTTVGYWEMAADFYEARRQANRLSESDPKAARALLEIVGRLDHVFLNETEPFDEVNPTAENVAKHICEQLAAAMPDAVAVKSVAVWESDRCGATYIP